MEQYIYQADLYCKDCVTKIKAESTNRPLNPMDETSYDSDSYPKGPYTDQESDSPEHCAGCGMFFENPLTQAGYEYVRETVADFDETGRGRSEIISEWRNFYAEAWDNA